MRESYRFLTLYEDRCRIYATGKSGLSNGAIARQLGRDRTAIHREIRCNGDGRSEPLLRHGLCGTRRMY